MMLIWLKLTHCQVDFASLERQRSAARVKAEMEEKRAIAKREEQLNKALKEFKGKNHFGKKCSVHINFNLFCRLF